jgi:sugar phosphate isomerase/epimerase
VTPAFQTLHLSPAVGSDVPLDAVLPAVRDAGFTHVGLDVASLDAHVRRGGTLADVAAWRDELGLVFTDLIHLSVTGDDATTIDRVAWLCRSLEIPWCLAAVPDAAPRAAIVASLRRAAAVLDRDGTRLAIEFCSHLHLATLRDAVDLATDVGWGHCALVLDALHFHRAGADWTTLSSLAAEHIAYLQVSDARAAPPWPARVESRSHRMLPGYGDLDIVGWLRSVAATGFDGLAVAEVLADRWRVARPAVVARAVHTALVDVLSRAG